MTDARDELAEVVESFLMDASREFYSYRSVAGVVGLETGYGNEPVMIDCHALADAILAAGWIKRHRALPICAPFDHIMYVSCAICGETPEDAAYDRP